MNTDELVKRWTRMILKEGFDPTRLTDREIGDPDARALVYPPDGTSETEQEELLRTYQIVLAQVLHHAKVRRADLCVELLIQLERLNALRRMPKQHQDVVVLELYLSLVRDALPRMRAKNPLNDRAWEMYGYHAGVVYEQITHDFRAAADAARISLRSTEKHTLPEASALYRITICELWAAVQNELPHNAAWSSFHTAAGTLHAQAFQAENWQWVANVRCKLQLAAWVLDGKPVSPIEMKYAEEVVQAYELPGFEAALDQLRKLGTEITAESPTERLSLALGY